VIDLSNLLFFTSPIGLGHATRDIAIAKKLIKLDLQINFVSGQAAYSLISSQGYDVVDAYHPKSFFIQCGQLRRPLIWLLRYLTYYRECKRISEGIVNSRQCDIIVSDEDFASIQVASRLNKKRILISDITETHFTHGILSLVERKMNKSMRKIMSKCDRVIIPDFGDDEGNVIYVGPIVREVSSDREALRKKLDFHKKTIVLSVGGTDAGQQLIDKSLEAFARLRKRLDVDLVLVTGPILTAPIELSHNIRTVGFIDNLHEYIYAADVVISLAGRSTIDESIVYGTPGIFIPVKDHFEQEWGAKRLGYKYQDIFRLEALIERALNLNRNAFIENDGALKAAKIILDLM
jgi:UDP-N-acetylglucosamine--N-acetylmuramyl-(pentapeptide) pyrophosphoryl-undecaprenol N-acetylglucosamine transferase